MKGRFPITFVIIKIWKLCFHKKNYDTIISAQYGVFFRCHFSVSLHLALYIGSSVIKQKQTLTKIILNRLPSEIEIMKIEQCYKNVI